MCPNFAAQHYRFCLSRTSRERSENPASTVTSISCTACNGRHSKNFAVACIDCIAPPVSELGALGVSRISVGGAFAFAAIGELVAAARELREQGTYGYFEHMAQGVKAVRDAFG